MSLTGKNNEEKIWNFLTGKGLNSYGAAGLMGNLFAESGLNPRNLQNTYEKSSAIQTTATPTRWTPESIPASRMTPQAMASPSGHTGAARRRS